MGCNERENNMFGSSSRVARNTMFTGYLASLARFTGTPVPGSFVIFADPRSFAFQENELQLERIAEALPFAHLCDIEMNAALCLLHAIAPSKQ